MVQIAMIGFGYWGKNLVRNFYHHSLCEVKIVVELDATKRQNCQKLYPNVRCTDDISEVWQNENIQAVVIATPISTHYEITKKALWNKKHILVEKPLVDTEEKLQELTQLAERQQMLLMLDYTFLYTSAVQKIKDLLDSKQMGDWLYIDATRINLGIFQTDANVLADLATHDLAICLYLLNELPISVKAVGVSHTSNQVENMAYITLFYPHNRLIHLHCSWTSPVKIRQMLIGGSQKMIVYNDMEPTEKVKVYEAKLPLESHSEQQRTQTLIDYRMGDIYIPKLDTTEALQNLADDFINSILNHTQPRANTDLAKKVVKVLEASQKSLKLKGQEVKIVLS